MKNDNKTILEIFGVILTIGMLGFMLQISLNDAHATIEIPESTTPTTLSAANYTTYSNEELGITFEYPVDWTLKEKTSRFDTSADVQVYDRFNEFKYTGSDRGMDIALDTFDIHLVAELLRDAVLSDTTDSSNKRLIEDVKMSDINIGGKDTATFLYTIKPLFGQEYALQVFVMDKDGEVVYGAYQNVPEDFDSPESQEIRNHILNSFQFTDSSSNSGDNDNDNDDGEDEDN